jgi:hypothetical protein
LEGVRLVSVKRKVKNKGRSGIHRHNRGDESRNKLHVNADARVSGNLAIDKKVNAVKARGITMKVIGFDVIGKKGYMLVWLVLVVLSAQGWGQAGGDYILTWSTIDGGGGQSSGGQYTLTGTIGQPDAAYSAGGDYELLGGFWPGGPLCIVEFHHFARFAELWLDVGSGLAGDLDGDNDVDIVDLCLFVDEWLYICPYNWPLK